MNINCVVAKPIMTKKRVRIDMGTILNKSRQVCQGTLQAQDDVPRSKDNIISVKYNPETVLNILMMQILTTLCDARTKILQKMLILNKIQLKRIIITKFRR